MNRRMQQDVLVVGGGVVGATCALALAQRGLAVSLIEAGPPPHWSASEPDLRVYAFAPDNAALLDSLSVWQPVLQRRAQAYRRMRVWDAAGGDALEFDADALGRAQLGWIVENNLLAERLWAALDAAGVSVHAGSAVEEMEQDVDDVRLRLGDGSRLQGRLLVAADGAQSRLRAQLGLSVQAHDYAQRGLVAFVATAQPHQHTAWQRFLPSGPLALLPFTEGRSSIVWTLPSAEAERLLAVDDSHFNDALTRAFGGRLGDMQLLSPRAAFPLRRQLADDYLCGRTLLIGDAAHVVHPLAGQGVNLGLRDVAALCALVDDAGKRGKDWASPHRLQRWSRQRRSEVATAAYAFDGINRLFSNDEMHTSLLRGPLLGLAGKLPPLVNLLWRKAAGS
ncbi:UbiH/UbiF family hydroxylase [Pseudoxanthomonas dokdonensis]|uniref:2-octaprenyl-3-methyl-6-methoxy-1,4-benzoquinol hydroxylase n=1 Tax=Pseudoxanthomonas dokdonensis TaxID=344882 RepID=A0A0R0D1H3_9GAMM|nr:UbiH/UbiF family hydroxylase [Pseudoxanthomonas dokdonensis]KRG71240.1 2-octaprenyl-3-methyl-6-methoxy-1,4-benzoquinol hydroxylase [Pseudoxanthomonas dokdonensis]